MGSGAEGTLQISCALGRNCLDFVEPSTYHYTFNFPGRFVGDLVRKSSGFARVIVPPGPPGGASIDSASLGDAPRGVEATITEVLPNALFRAKLKDGRQVLAHASVSFRIRETRVVPGDRIVLELSPLEDRQGRIIRRV